jgi:large subunit ribosomal protein L4
MKLTVYSSDATSQSEKEFDLPAFEGDKGLQALKDLLVTYHANRRQGSSKSKTRAEVAGTGKKVYRQKGTGNARHGDRQSPIYVGGGTAHGAKIQDWSKGFNKKAKKLATARALFDKASSGGIHVIESFSFESPKTKVFTEVLGRIDSDAKRVLICDQQFDNNTILSARNLPSVDMMDAASLNAWDIVRHPSIVISERGLEQLLSRL